MEQFLLPVVSDRNGQLGKFRKNGLNNACKTWEPTKMPKAQEKKYRYQAYGYTLVSDIPLLQLMPADDTTSDEITIRACKTLPDIPDHAIEIGPLAHAAPGFLSINMPNIMHFVALDGNTLLYRPRHDIDARSLQVFLLGSGLGAVMMQRRHLILHGNGVEIDGQCVMCVGPSGVGKSTTAAGLMKRGFKVMSDDVCVIDKDNHIVPGIPHIKLWQEAAAFLDVQTDSLSRVRPEMEKYRVPMQDAFCADLVPIKTVYVLSPSLTDTVSCTSLEGRQKFLALQRNTYRLPFIEGLGLSALHFQQLANLSKAIDVKVIKRPIQGYQLAELLDILVADASQNRLAS